MRQASWAEPVLMTADDLLALPEDGWSYELVEGRLVRMALAAYSHSRASARLLASLLRFVDESQIGMVFPPGTRFQLAHDPDTVLASDAAFLAAERLPSPDPTGYPELAPDVVVEVVSQTQTMKQMRQKAETWLLYAVRLVWIVDPGRKRVEVWREGNQAEALVPGQNLSGEDVLPGFSLPVDEIFR